MIKVVDSLHTWMHMCWVQSFTCDIFIPSLPMWVFSGQNYFKQSTRRFPAIHPNDPKLGNGLAGETNLKDCYARQPNNLN